MDNHTKMHTFHPKSIYNTPPAHHHQSAPPMTTVQPRFNINDVCVDRTTYSASKRRFLEVCIRRFNDDGTKAIVHFVHNKVRIEAIDVRKLNEITSDGFLRPNPYMICKRRLAAEEEEDAKRMRKE